MLKTKDLIENIDEKYVPMLKQVNIPDFTKCIATLAWKEMTDIRDDVIKRYLLQWAESKYRFYQMLGNKIKVDCPFTYNRLKSETKERLINLKQEFPAYIPWIEVLRECSTNKLTNREMSWELRKWICEGFPQFKYEGSSITRFFKSCLCAPDTLVNRLAQVFENSTVDATYTISIDPVDIMLASESPYDWSSCYKLDPRDEGNHADGCLAALIDSSSLITYVWNKEGEYQLDASHLKFKSIRYKKMRAWISISPDFNAFYMNSIYPGKGEYGEDFEKKLRIIIEKNISDYVKLEDKWMPHYDSLCYRKYPYGYDEYIERKNNTYAASVDRGIYAAKEAAMRAAKQTVVVEEAPVQKGKESYEQGKERSRLEKKLKKLEEKISKLETAIEEKKEELLSPEYATAYTKLEQIQAEIEENEMELLEVMEEWDEVGQKLEEL
jgi:hypothetical protein